MSLKRRIHEFLGGSKMAALSAGAKAPAFALQSTDGKKTESRGCAEKRPGGGGLFQSELPHLPVHCPVPGTPARKLQRRKLHLLGHFARRRPGHSRILSGIRRRIPLRD